MEQGSGFGMWRYAYLLNKDSKQRVSERLLQRRV